MRIISILTILFGAIGPAAVAATALDGPPPVSNWTQLETIYSSAETSKIDVTTLLQKTLLGSCYTNDKPENAISVEFAYVLLEGSERARPVIMIDSDGYVGMNSRTSPLLTSTFNGSNKSTFTILMRATTSKTYAAEIDAANFSACNQVVCPSGPSYCQFSIEE